MEMTHDEKLRLDNFKAQYNTIKSEIEAVNSELEAAILKRDEAKKGFDAIQESIAEANALLSDLKSEEEQLLNKRASEEDRLSKWEAALKVREDSIISTEAELKERLDGIKRTKEQEIAKLTDRIEDLKEEVQILEGTAISYGEHVEALSREDDRLTVEIRTKEAQFKEDSDLYQSTISSLDAEIGEKQKVLDTLLDRIEEEKGKIEGPMNLLVSEQTRIDQERRDLTILINRYRAAMKEHFPDISPGI